MEIRNVATLLPIIHQHIQTGTMVYSDEWQAYNQEGNIPGLEHRTVNHSLFFVDPVTGVHTQTIESYWNRVKTKLKTMKGVHRDLLPGYLDEFIWREKAGQAKLDAILHKISGSIRCKYPLHLQNGSFRGHHI